MARSVLSICSANQSLAAEFDDIRHIGRAHNYSLSFVNVHIGIGLSKYQTKKAETTSPSTTTRATIEQQKKRMYVEITYAGQTTNSIRSKFTHLSRTNYV
jgi:hypothetical protein